MKKTAIDFICIIGFMFAFSCEKNQQTTTYRISEVIRRGADCEYVAVAKNQPIVRFQAKCGKYKIGDTWKQVVIN